MLTRYPILTSIVNRLQIHLEQSYPEFFGSSAEHPILGVRGSKVIHDNLWGTNPFSWRELALIDSPILQRLRNIHQTGLAYFVYPSARHSRFEHSLGVTTVASRAFDGLVQRSRELIDIARLFDDKNPDRFLTKLREEIRLAALLHDTGHSLYSHTSEMVYSKLPLMEQAVDELSTLAGRKKGAGEVISFCISRTKSLRDLFERAKARLDENLRSEVNDIDLDNVSLLIIGRSKHPYLQFAADIISSDLDADKLDYLLRDATSAGLPLRYDLERYLYTINIAKDRLPDGEDYLQSLYQSLNAKVERKERDPSTQFPYYETYRLRLPRQAMSTIEQIVICKFMLYSYIYHHRKVRAGEALLSKMLMRATELWRRFGATDLDILERFMAMTDSALDGYDLARSEDPGVAYFCNKVRARLLPREVFGFVSNMYSYAEGQHLADFVSILLDPARKVAKIRDFETVLGGELLKLDGSLGKTPEEALWTAGAWLDVPGPPKFENIHLLVGGSAKANPFSNIFPIEYWIQAYETHRYCVRIFAFSKYYDHVKVAARKTCEQVIGISTNEFYEAAEKVRK